MHTPGPSGPTGDDPQPLARIPLPLAAAALGITRSFG